MNLGAVSKDSPEDATVIQISEKILSEENDDVKRYLKSLALGKGHGPAAETTFDGFREKSPPKVSGHKGTPRGNSKPSGVDNGGTTPCVPKQKGKGSRCKKGQASDPM